MIRKTIYEIIIVSLVLTVLNFSIDVEAAERVLPDDNLSYPVLIELKPGGLASGFYLNTGGYIYFVTARHVLFVAKTNESTKNIEYTLNSNNAELLSYSSDISDPTANIFMFDLKTLDKAGEIKYHKTQDIAVVRVAKVIKNIGSDFSLQEFENQKKDVQILCKAIKSEGYEFGVIETSENTVEWLNRILQVPDLYEKLIAKKPNLTLTDEIKKLKEQTETNRKRPFKDLKDDEQKVIKSLNRLMIELAYPQITPKINKFFRIGFIKGVQATQTAKLGIISVSVSSIKRFNEVLVSNDIYVFGYPSSIGLKETPQFDYKRPLLRRGTIAGKYEDKKTIILDCAVYYGNSGGPVIEIDEVSPFARQFKLIGVISEFIPFAETWVNVTQKYKYATVSNSGYSVATSTDAIFELTEEYITIPTLSE